MAKIEENYIIDRSYVAKEAIAPGRAVITSGTKGEIKYPTAALEYGLGIAVTEAAASGDIVRVIKKGFVKVKAFASASVGDFIAIKNTVGEVYAPTFNSDYTTGDAILGYYEEAPVASGDIVVAWIDPQKIIL